MEHLDPSPHTHPSSSQLHPFPQQQHLVRHRPSPLKIRAQSRKIRKPSLPLPEVQFRRPVIIHTYSPEVIQTDPDNFMWLVQSLTGSSHTRSRCRKNNPAAAAVAQLAADDHKTEQSNTDSVTRSSERDRVQPSTETNCPSCGEQDAESLESTDHIGCGEQGLKSFEPTDDISLHSSSSNLQPVPSHPQASLPSLNRSQSFEIENIFNDSSFASSSTAWHPDRLLISPFEGSNAWVENFFSPSILFNTSTLDARTLEQLASPAANDTFSYKELLEDGRATDTFLAQQTVAF